MNNSVQIRFYNACLYLSEMLRLSAPVDTGNLALNSINIVFKSPTRVTIVIGAEVAPYALYTNEPWISPRWRGRTNPNEHWVQAACEAARPVMRALISGSISEEEYLDLLRITRQDAYKRINQMQEAKNGIYQ